MPEMAVKIGDEWVPLNNCDWIFLYACGCPHSVATAARGDRIDAATEEQAWRLIYDTQREVDKAKKAGETCALITHDRWKSDYFDRFNAGHTCENGPVDRSGEIPGQLDLLDALAGA